jgi:hypothetical protein
MQRSKVVKSLFWELRAAGVNGSAKEVLRLAHFLLRSHLGEVGRADDYGRVVEPRSFPYLPVDVALATGGWGLVEFENVRAGRTEDEFEHDPTRRSKFKRMSGRS